MSKVHCSPTRRRHVSRSEKRLQEPFAANHVASMVTSAWPAASQLVLDEAKTTGLSQR